MLLDRLDIPVADLNIGMTGVLTGKLFENLLSAVDF